MLRGFFHPLYLCIFYAFYFMYDFNNGIIKCFAKNYTVDLIYESLFIVFHYIYFVS